MRCKSCEFGSSHSLSAFRPLPRKQVPCRLAVDQRTRMQRSRMVTHSLSPGVGSKDSHKLQTAVEQNRCPSCYVITGVSGAGKRKLAQELRCPFYDGDDFHTEKNKEKMKKGEALTDDDRLPWLQKLAQLLEQHVKAQTPCVLACSCLKLRYRKVLSGENEGADHAGDIAFVLLQPSREELQRRVQERESGGTHFMPASLLDSQLNALEVDPASMTYGALKPDAIVAAILEARSCQGKSE